MPGGASRTKLRPVTSLVSMLMPEEAAQGFIDALVARHFQVKVASNVRGRTVSVLEHPGATVEFKLDHLGEIRVEFVFDGRPVEVLNFVQGGGEIMAQYVADKISGSGGGQ